MAISDYQKRDMFWYPPGNDHISHQTKKGKQNHRSQKCRLVGDMWSFPGGYQFVNFRWVYLGSFEEFFLAPGGITDQDLQTAATTTFLYQIPGSIVDPYCWKIIIWVLIFLRKRNWSIVSLFLFASFVCFWAQKHFGPLIYLSIYIYIFIWFIYQLTMCICLCFIVFVS